MKRYFLTFWFVLSTPFAGIALADGNANPTPNGTLVQNEYAKQQAKLQEMFVKLKKMLHDQEMARQKAVQESKAESVTDNTGLKALKSYDSLMTSRYATDMGEFQGWRMLGDEDVENINKLFETYLRSKPLKGRVSAGEGHRVLDWGMTRLEELQKMHGRPKPQNNSSLEVLSHETKEAERKLKSVTAFADRLGLKLVEPKEEELMTVAPTDKREPASETSK